MREFLKGLDLDKETIDTIMAEHGKIVTESKEEIMSLRDQVNEYKTQVESSSESIKNLQTLTDENKNLKAELQMNGSNVKKEFSKFVRSEVMSNVNDETDFAKALETYKKDNPQYFGDTVVRKIQSSPSLNNGGNPTQSSSDIMNDIIRNAK